MLLESTFHFDNNDEATIVHAGHMVLYRPKEPQKYEYYAKDQTEVTGFTLLETMSRTCFVLMDLLIKKVFHCGSGAEYQNLFCSMIKELQMCQDGYEEMLEIYLRQIFIRLQRHFKSSLNSDNSHAFEEIDNAISYFCEHYNEPINIDDYAKENHFSTSWFIRNFKLYTGLHQTVYSKKRIYNAEALLQNTQYNINEIAQIIGYDNPLYFSRVFQKTKGISPSEYRKNISQRVFNSPSL